MDDTYSKVILLQLSMQWTPESMVCMYNFKLLN